MSREWFWRIYFTVLLILGVTFYFLIRSVS